jgi:uncharacterized protein YndB with AHSA1/START domain
MSNPATEAKGVLEGAHVTDFVLEIDIQAEPGAVWNALTDDIARWWPRPFYCGGGSSAEPSFKLEAFPGGRMWEDWGDGNGLLWANVLNVQTGKRLEMVGTTGPAWGGPTTWFSTFELTPDGAGTKLRFSESGFGRVTEAAGQEKEKGWRFLFDGALRAHLEGKEPPVWKD